MTLNEAIIIFENVDISNDVLTKKKHRELVKKYHTDSLGGDSKKIRDINVAYEIIQKHQAQQKLKKNTKEDREKILKRFKNELSLLKEKLASFKEELKENKKNLHELFDDLEYFEHEIKKYERRLKINPFYFLFENKTKTEKLKNLFLVSLGFEILFILFIHFLSTNCFLLSTGEILFSNVTTMLLLAFNFIERRYNVNITKKYIAKCLEEKENIETEISEIQNDNAVLNWKKEKTQKRIEFITESLNEYSA